MTTKPQTRAYADEDACLASAQSIYDGYVEDCADHGTKHARGRLIARIQMGLRQAYAQGGAQ